MTTTRIRPPLLLAVDASVLVATLLRTSGQVRIAHPALRLVIPDYTWNETQHELLRRIDHLVAHGSLTNAEAQVVKAQCFTSIEDNITVIAEGAYSPLETEARWRITRDPRDWQTVALALDAGIWTEDSDFLGCGIATWTTSTLTQLLAILDNNAPQPPTP